MGPESAIKHTQYLENQAWAFVELREKWVVDDDLSISNKSDIEISKEF